MIVDKSRKIVLIICICAFLFCFGICIGRWQSSEWNATKIHHKLQVDGYNYCPYCGEEIKEGKE